MPAFYALYRLAGADFSDDNGDSIPLVMSSSLQRRLEEKIWDAIPISFMEAKETLITKRRQFLPLSMSCSFMLRSWQAPLD